jgi:hypothetical protein
MGSHDSLHLLAVVEKSVFYSARRKRGDALRTAPFVSQSVDFSNTQPAVDDGHILMHWHSEQMVVATIVSEPPEPESEMAVERRTESSGETIANIWQGKGSLRRTVFVGGLGTGCWMFLCLMAMAVVMDMDTYTGTFMLRQWVVLLLILAMPVAGIWWSVGMMRCTLRMQREGHHFLIAGSGFVIAVLILTHVVFTNVGWAGEWLFGWWDTVNNRLAATEVVHDPFLGRIVVRGEIGFGSYKALEKALQVKPKLTLIEIDSPGGYVYEGLAMARLIEKNKLDTVSFGVCASACTLLLAAGQERYLGKDVLVGFHRSRDYRISNAVAWLSTDYQIASYYRSRNAKDDFIQRALDTPSYGLWIPEHWEMYAAGYATKRWGERKSGY